MIITYDDLLDFQVNATVDLSSMINDYPSGKYKAVYNRNTGMLEPFVCRLRAITGAGKTPILAATAAKLKDGIILWTTSRGAIISQTYENLRAGGKYYDLLPSNTNVYMLNDMSIADWKEMLSAKEGLTILLATVASFNQTGDALKIHRKGDYGSLSRWEMLSQHRAGDESRNRKLYVFYDEGHGATAEQFERLADINPKAFVLASASPFPSDLAYLLPGNSHEEREKALTDRTISINTKKVVDAGLLKTRLYFTDCNTSTENAIMEAQSKYLNLVPKLASHDMTPVMCCIVNTTQRGVDVWELLVKQGVNPDKIAVHLNGAKDIAHEKYGSYMGMKDTYTGKKAAERSPAILKQGGYTHIIWNLTLREGWDEPLAYIAYIDDRGKSTTDMVQKIGRFIRQPQGKSFDDPDLNSAYFYFNIPDEDFANLIEKTQQELELEGHEVLRVPDDVPIPASREVPSNVSAEVPVVYLFRGKPEDNDKIILDEINLIDKSERRAQGHLKTRVYETAKGENITLREDKIKDVSDSISAWDFIAGRLQRIDSRIVNSTGTIFTNDIKFHSKLIQEIQWGSPAISFFERAVSNIKEALEDQIRLMGSGGIEVYKVPPFRLVSPNVKGVGVLKEERYKVRTYKNSVHREYNGLNQFEVKVADALDRTGKLWARNPGTNNGYGIPIPVYGADSGTFRPDFLLWGEETIWAIDPKGKHLLDSTLSFKMLDLTDLGVSIVLILDGTYDKSGDVWVKTGQEGFTIIKKYHGGIKAKVFKDLDKLLSELN